MDDSTTELFDRAVAEQPNGNKYNGYAELYSADKPLAIALHQAAVRVQAELGGLYSGKLDFLQSTLCDPALGVDASGCCYACGLISRDRMFEQRLRCETCQWPCAIRIGNCNAWPSSIGTLSLMSVFRSPVFRRGSRASAGGPSALLFEGIEVPKYVLRPCAVRNSETLAGGIGEQCWTVPPLFHVPLCCIHGVWSQLYLLYHMLY